MPEGLEISSNRSCEFSVGQVQTTAIIYVALRSKAKAKTATAFDSVLPGAGVEEIQPLSPPSAPCGPTVPVCPSKRLGALNLSSLAFLRRRHWTRTRTPLASTATHVML